MSARGLAYGLGFGATGRSAAAALDGALAQLRTHPLVYVVGRSPWVVTAPVGAAAEPYTNGAVLIVTGLSPTALLDVARALEARAGRMRERRWERRALDVDVLWFEGGPVTLPGLRVPHPRLRQRPFAYRPLLASFADAGRPPPGALCDLAALNDVVDGIPARAR